MQKDFGKMPKYKAPVYDKPQKVDDMYPLKWTGHDNVSSSLIYLKIHPKPGTMFSLCRYIDDRLMTPLCLILLDKDLFLLHLRNDLASPYLLTSETH